MMSSEVFQHSLSRFLTPIAPLMDDGAISEILINGYQEVWIEKNGVLHRSGVSFPDHSSLEALLVNISQYSGRPFDRENPILEARLPDGSRLEAVMAPLAQNGPAVSIRRFSKSRLSINQLIDKRALTSSSALFLARAIARKANIVIAGGTGSGKTSLLQALAGFFHERERIVVLEDTHEIEIPRPHVVYLQSKAADEHGEGRVGIRELLHATLRLRPDRIVVGEIRGGEALDMIQAITSGHGGSMTTVHANSPRDALSRIETMAMMAQEDIPHAALRGQVASAVDFIVQIGRNIEGRRRITEITAVSGKLHNDNYLCRTLFVEGAQGELVRRALQKKGESAA